MAPPLSQYLKWTVGVAVTGLAVFGLLTIGPKPQVVAQESSSIVDVRTEDPVMNAAIARARTTLPTF